MSKQLDSNEIQSYLVRFWREADGKQGALRVSLLHLPDGERVGFHSVDEMCVYLRARTGSDPDETTRVQQQHD